MATEEIILKVQKSSESVAGTSTSPDANAPKSFLGKVSNGLGLMGKGVGGLLTKAGVWGVILNQVVDLLGKILRELANISPTLKGSLLLMKKAYMVALKPLADTIGMILRPLGLLMLRGAANLVKALKSDTLIQKYAEGKEITTEDMKLEAIKMIFNPLGYLFETIYAVIKNWSAIVERWKGEFNAVFDTIKEKLTGVLDFFISVYDFIIETINIINDWIDTYLIQPVKNFFIEIFLYLKKFYEKARDWVYSNIIVPVQDFVKKIKEYIDPFIQKIENWVNTYVIDPIQSLLKKLKEKIDSYSFSNSPASKAYNYIKNAITGNDFVVTKTGQVIQTNPQDTIMATKSNSGFSKSTNVSTMNINISANVNNDMDINVLARKISEAMQRELSYRTG